MRRPLIGTDSIVAMAIRPLLILAVALAAFFIAPAAASATPAADVSTAVSGRFDSSATDSTDSAAGVRAVYTCRYSSLPPFQTLNFTCTVRFGSLQVILNCVDGRQIFGPILQAVGTYNFSLSCAPTSFSTFNVRELS